MPTYAYRWADGTISVCSAKDKEEAIEIFDQVSPVTRKLLIRIPSRLAITIRPSVDEGWKIEEDGLFADNIDVELLQHCYPHFEAELFPGLFFEPDNCEPKRLENVVEKRERLGKALAQDLRDARLLHAKYPPPPDFVNLFPKGLAGQEN